jgi:hypothetical protein
VAALEERLGDLEVQTLRLARLELPDFHPEAPGSCDIFGFLVRDGRDCVLVDTGVGSGSDLIERLYQPERVEPSSSVSTSQSGWSSPPRSPLQARP